MNINKIKLSGTTYSIQDENATKTVELTQAQYDALAVKDPNTFYIITDAEGADLTNYYTKTQVDASLSGKQDTLVSGTNIKTINNESILGSGNIEIQGGGKAIEAGRGISITTGETADTVSFNLPISAGTGTDSIKLGAGTASGGGSLVHGIGSTSRGTYSNVLGFYCDTSSNYTFTAGAYLNNNTEFGAAFGKYNTTTISTLFSVGNGTSDSARHNAFEIRQNGDIYITKDGQDVKLQDQLGGGGGGSITIDPSLDSGSTNAVANSAITNAINTLTSDKFDFVGTAGYTGYDELFFAANNVQKDRVYFSKVNGNSIVSAVQMDNLQLVETSAITTSISSSSTDSQVPSAKAVYDALQEGGGGGMTEDDELLLSTALTDLNSRKIDTSEVKAKYQMKGDYATKDYVATALEPYETKLDEINTEEVTAYALNDLNNKFGGLKLTKITESEYAALTTKDENTLYVVVADPQTR